MNEMITGQDILAADSIFPEEIPAAFTRAIAYADGLYKWTPDQEARFGWIAHYTVTGDPAAAAYARIQDVENFDATPDKFPGFAAERTRLGHSCGIAYASLSVIPAILAALDQAGMADAPWGLLPAWWWGRPRFPTVTEVQAELLAAYGARVGLDRLEGCQWQNNPRYDVIVTYSPHLLHRPHGWPS